MFVTYFYSIYERVILAKDLVKRKVDQDFLDDFSKQEWSSKFEKKQINLIVEERFQYLIKAIVTVNT
jgi:hypothetical protein